jgi:predicted ATPase/class 3 adenylate cyclase
MSAPEFPSDPAAPPAGPAADHGSSVTASFLMTDIEGSTRLWAEQPDAMRDALAEHDALLRAAVATNGGRVFKTTGDGMLAVFDRADGAVAGALTGQRDLAAHAWPTTAPLRVRMAVHSGTAEMRDGDYFGPTLNRLARLLAIGHGGQVLASSAVAGLVGDGLPAGTALVDRGEHPLRDLDRPERVFQVVAPDLRSDFPPLRSRATRSNLPPELSSFIGRERQLAEVRDLLGSRRLVSLVGVGGTGKTRLALQLGRGLVEVYPDGVWLVELAPIADAALVTPAVARALGVPESGQPGLDAVVDFLREKVLLLLLDNCEHLVDAAAVLAERLLLECPSLRILATSREALSVTGEASVQVPSLGLPGGRGHDAEPGALDPDEVARAESVRLFVERARATLPDFVLDATTAGPVAEICRRLDGIPLALELAAARVNVLSVAEIAEGLSDRFRLLTGGRRTAVPRQQTLQALIDWSWDLLTEADQRLLRRLSVFAGGFTLDAAADVTADPAQRVRAGGRSPTDGPEGGAGEVPAALRLATLDGLGRLVDRSLLVVEHGAGTRYGMLETIRQYAGERLAASGEGAVLRDRHLARFRRLVADAAQGLLGPGMARSLDGLDIEQDNVRAALDWAAEADAEAFIEMAAALGPYWWTRTTGTEGIDRLQAATAVARGLPDPPADGLAHRRSLVSWLLALSAVLGSVTNRQTDLVAGWADEAVSLARQSEDPMAIRFARAARHMAAQFGYESPASVADRAGDQASLASELDDPWAIAVALTGASFNSAALGSGAAEAEIAHLSDAARRSGNPYAIGYAELAWTYVRGARGDVDAASAHAEEALVRFEEVHDRRMQLAVRSDLVHVFRQAGRADEALAQYRETILEWQRLGQRGAIANQLESFAFLALEAGSLRRAAVLIGSADRLREVSRIPMLARERAEYDAAVGRLREELGSVAFEQARAEGRDLTTDQAVALALAD